MNPHRLAPAFVALAGLLTGAAHAGDPVMAEGFGGFGVAAPLLTIGETFTGTTGALNPSTAGDYTPPGVIDGLGAYELDADTVRVFANHELRNNHGYAYELSDGAGGSFALTGARVSYFDIDKTTRAIVDAGLAYDRIRDANGELAVDNTIFRAGSNGFSRLCSSSLFEAGSYGLEDTIYFTGEEDGGSFSPVGGAEWALDVVGGEIWQLPELGRGAWENAALLDTGNPRTVALILTDDTSPLNIDATPEREAAPLYLYIGEKQLGGNFIERNGLARGTLHVWVADAGALSPLDFRGTGSLAGRWVAIDNSQHLALASEQGNTGFDEYGYPTQRSLWAQAKALGAFGFSRPEDAATNPADGSQAVFASTGVDIYAIDPLSGDGADTFGTVYVVKTNFVTLEARLTILYDGDADPTRALRSPDNLDWADDGAIYVQEDEAEEDTLSGEDLFGPNAVNPHESGVVRIDPTTGALTRVLNIDRSVVLDGSLDVPTDAVDRDACCAGEWENSGILDVSTLFGAAPGTLFLLDVQAHGIEDQFFPSRINDGDLVEGGQLLFLEALAGKGFVDIGEALAGTLGEPVLQGDGALGPNSPYSLELSGAQPSAMAALFVGFSRLDALFKGGLFVPQPEFVWLGTTSATGAVELVGSFMPGAPAGTELYLQYWILDDGAVAGLAASNAIRGVTP